MNDSVSSYLMSYQLEASDRPIEGPFGYAFDYYKTSDFVEVENLVGEVLQLTELSYERRRVDDRLLYTITCVVLNLFMIRLVHPDAYVFFSRSEGVYTGLPVPFRRMERVVEALERFGLIESDTGYWRGPDQPGRRSRMKATPLLLHLLQSYGVKVHMVEQSEWKALVQLKDEDKNQLELPEDPVSESLIDGFTATLNEINGAFRRAFIGLHISDSKLHDLAEALATRDWPKYLDFSRKRVHRVFNNGTFAAGGRFFGAWWQNIPKEYRPFIHIAHEGDAHSPTIEIDYSSMHPAIAYARVGLALDFDPYGVNAVLECADRRQRAAIRDTAKIALNVALNATSREMARGAVVRELVRERDRDYDVPKSGEDYLPEGCPDVPDLLEELLALNEPIAQFIATGAGVGFMREESDIAERVMLRMLRDHGAVVLPVHDSFLAHEDYGDQLEAIMLEEFTRATGQSCELRFDDVDYSGDWPGDINPFINQELLDELGDRIPESLYRAETFERMWNEWCAFG